MDFVILKVNGTDLSQSSHEEAVKVFQQADEPIVVEVVRRPSIDSSTSTPSTSARGPPTFSPKPPNRSAVRKPQNKFVHNNNRLKKCPVVPQASLSPQVPSRVLSRDHSAGSTESVESMRHPRQQSVNSVALQTDDTSLLPAVMSTMAAINGEPSAFTRFHTPVPLPSGFELSQPGTRHPLVLAQHCHDDGLTDLECGLLDFGDLEEDDEEDRLDMDYQEIVIHRGDKDRLGLTLCYSPCDESMQITDVYVNEIEKESIAAMDGRIHEGDQILQINGQDVTSRDQAVTLFRSSGPTVNLLLARPRYPFAIDNLDNLHMELLGSQTGQGAFDFRALYDMTTMDGAYERHDKDSGVGRATDDSTRTEESSEQEAEGDTSLNRSNESFTSIDDTNRTSAFQAPVLVSSSSQGHIDAEIAQLNQAMKTLEMECQELARLKLQKQQRLQQVQLSKVPDAASPTNQAPPAQPSLALPQGLVRPQPIRFTEQQPCRQPRLVPRMGTRLDLPPLRLLGHPMFPVPEASGSGSGNTSAYNTGDSTRSTPLTLELTNQEGGSMLCLADPATRQSASTAQPKAPGRVPCSQPGAFSHFSRAGPLPAPPSDSEKSTQTDTDSQRTRSSQGHRSRDLPLPPVPQQQSSPVHHPGAPPSGPTTNGNSRKAEGDKSLRRQERSRSHDRKKESKHHSKDGAVAPMYDIYDQYAQVMYTTPNNLEHTIRLQQQLFQAQLKQRSVVIRLPPVPEPSVSTSASATSINPPVSNGTDREYDIPEGANVDSVDSQAMEWVVKKRPDGTRYIARRPVRARILKERAKRVAEERCGLTTDDDAMSEMKMGRYWNKTERRKHLEKAKEHRRQKKEALLRSLSNADDQKSSSASSKTTRHKERQGRVSNDNLVNVQDKPPNHSSSGGIPIDNPLLSVATV